MEFEALLLENKQYRKFKSDYIKTFGEDYIEALNSAIDAYIVEYEKTKNVRRDIFRKKYPNEINFIGKFFISFTSFKKIVDALIRKEPEGISREEKSIKKSNTRTETKRFFVTSIVSGFDIDEKAIQTSLKYCEETGSQLVLLLMRGCGAKDTLSNDIWEKYSDYIVTEYKLNEKLLAVDFKLYPQQILPLTGLHRFGQKKHSLIVAAPKQFFSSVPRGKHKYPHVIWTTGTVSSASYRDDRPGRIAEQDHMLGGLIVELDDRNKFFVRNVRFDKNYGFFDIDRYYNAHGVDINSSKKYPTILNLGDSHYGIECKVSDEAAKKLAEKVSADYIIFQDVCDNRSITHHEKNNILAKYRRSDIQQTLKAELDHLGEELEKWSKRFSKSTLVVVPSNHDDFISRWLSEGEFVKDIPNAKIGAELFLQAIEEKNPMEYYVKKNFNIPNIKFLKLDESFNIAGVELNNHGHKGSNGSRGSARTLENGFGKSTSGHTHSPTIWREIFIAGTNSILDPDYAAGGSSSWLNADVIQYGNGMRQLIIKIDGEFQMPITKGSSLARG